MAEIYRAQVVGARGFSREIVIKRILPELTEDPEFRELELKLRIGMNAGDLMIGPIHDGKEYSLFVLGSVINFASRLESSIAKPGTICVGEAVVEYLPADWRAELLGEYKLKSSELKLRAYEVTGAEPGCGDDHSRP